VLGGFERPAALHDHVDAALFFLEDAFDDEALRVADGAEAVLEVTDNGAGMTEEVRRRCTETHFSTKRNNALFAGLSSGMGLGLSFVLVILEHHHATLDIFSQPLRGARFRVVFPAARESGGNS